MPDKPSEMEVHRRRLYYVASKIVNTREFESDEFRVRLPKEAAALESMTYWQAEELLVKANDNHEQLKTSLAHARSAQIFLERTAKMRRELLLGDPEFQADAKNETQRVYNVANDDTYRALQTDLRTAETVVVYLEGISSAALETLQVVKKIRDAALSRKERDEDWAKRQQS